MKNYPELLIAGIVLLLFVEISAVHAQVEISKEALESNNAGVQLLKKRAWRESIIQFNAALTKDPSFELARQNLSVAHNNLALQLATHGRRLEDALKEFHQALYLDPDNQTTVMNFNYVILKLGKKPDKFEDRLKMGDDAEKSNDLRGAVVEYLAALKLKNDSRVHKKLGEVYRLLGKKNDASTEFAAAAKKA